MYVLTLNVGYDVFLSSSSFNTVGDRSSILVARYVAATHSDSLDNIYIYS